MSEDVGLFILIFHDFFLLGRPVLYVFLFIYFVSFSGCTDFKGCGKIYFVFVLYYYFIQGPTIHKSVCPQVIWIFDLKIGCPLHYQGCHHYFFKPLVLVYKSSSMARVSQATRDLLRVPPSGCHLTMSTVSSGLHDHIKGIKVINRGSRSSSSHQGPHLLHQLCKNHKAIKCGSKGFFIKLTFVIAISSL